MKHTHRKIIMTLALCNLIGAAFSQEVFSVSYCVGMDPAPEERPYNQDDYPLHRERYEEVLRIWDSIHPYSKFDNENASDKDVAWFRDSIRAWLLSGRMQGSDAESKKLLSAAEIQKSFIRIDTYSVCFTMQIEENPIHVAKFDIPTNGLKFSEDWSLDKTGVIVKRIRYYTVRSAEYDYGGNLRGSYENVIVKPVTSSALAHCSPVTYVLKPGFFLYYTDSCLVFENSRDTNLLWERIKTGLESGAIKGYADINAEKPLSRAEVKKIIMPPPDTLRYIDSITTDDRVAYIERNVKIDGIRFYEDWSLDMAGNITKQVRAYTLINKRFDVEGEFLGFFDFITIKP